MSVHHTSRADDLNDLGVQQTGTRSCPRRLVRLPHDDGACWCLTRLNDHGGTYRTAVGRVVMWEPYAASGEDVLEVLAAAHRDGLRVTVTGASPWNPGETFALIFEVDPAQRTDPLHATLLPSRQWLLDQASTEVAS